MDNPMTGSELKKDKRPGVALVWESCKWPKTNWAGQAWNDDKLHVWNANGYWQGGGNWRRHGLTGDDWTRQSLRDNSWS